MIVSLDQCKEYLGIDADDTDNDLLIERLIEDAESAIRHYTGRDFTVPVTVGEDAEEEVVREFEVGACKVWDHALGGWLLTIGDLADDPSSVTVKNLDGTSVKVMDLDYVDVWPRNRKNWEPITALRLRGVTLNTRQLVEVEGFWGFLELPADVRSAAITTVVSWYAVDVTKFSETFADAELAAPVRLGFALPRRAEQLLRLYRRAF